MRASLVIAATLLASLSACASVAEQDVPARIVEPDAHSRGELKRVVSEALNGADVTLAADALTKSSVLAIERKPARDASGQLISGREYERPEIFRLVKRGAKCALLHERTNARYELTNVQCAPLD